MKPIGVVIYRVGCEPGTLDAEWFYDKLDRKRVCKGIASGGNPGCMSGDYRIRYFGPDGEDAGSYDLSLRKEDEVYLGHWLENGKVLFRGIGIAIHDGIAMAWQPADSLE